MSWKWKMEQSMKEYLRHMVQRWALFVSVCVYMLQEEQAKQLNIQIFTLKTFSLFRHNLCYFLFLFHCCIMLVNFTGWIKYLKIVNSSTVVYLTNHIDITFISSVTWCWMQPTEKTQNWALAPGKKTSWRVLYSRPPMLWWWPLKTQIWISPGKVPFDKTVSFLISSLNKRPQWLPWHLKTKNTSDIFMFNPASQWFNPVMFQHH